MGRCTIKELGSLEQHPHTAASCENIDLGDVHPIEEDRVRRGLPQPIEGAQQGWLPAAAGAYDAHNLAWLNIHCNSRQQGDTSVRESLQVYNADFRTTAPLERVFWGEFSFQVLGFRNVQQMFPHIIVLCPCWMKA